jgi:hypothetical protein
MWRGEQDEGGGNAFDTMLILEILDIIRPRLCADWQSYLLLQNDVHEAQVIPKEKHVVQVAPV